MKIKATFYLSSGQILTIKCTSIDLTKLTGTKGNRTLDIKGADTQWTIDVDEIIAATARKCVF